MRYIFAGDFHGNINQAIEFLTPLNPDVVIQVGDFGIWPDLDFLDKATRNHGGAGDFPMIWCRKQAMPFPIIFTHGNHEDMVFLEKYRNTKYILPNLRYVHTGIVKVGKLKIAFLGGNFSFKAKKPRHIKPIDAESLTYSNFDILVTHDCAHMAPVKVFGRLQRDKQGNIVMPGSPAILDIIQTSKPDYHFFGHYHQKVETQIGETKSLGLNSTPYKDSYYILDL